MLDGYVRVSRVGGRAGPSYISPEVQEEKIRGYAALQDLMLDEVVPEEDVSGAKKVDDRELGRLIQKCEAGESEGIIVYRLDRFGRNAVEVLTAVRRLNDCGARLVGVSDGVDSAQPSGKLVIAVLAALAEEQWDRSRENWREASHRAVARGVHITPRVPLGYVRGGDGVLVQDPIVAPLVRDVFRMRVEGNSWEKCAAYLAANGVKIDRTSIGVLLRNRVYLGEARGPQGAVNPNAHQPIVTQAEWDAVALVVGQKFARTGSMAGVGLLKGIIRCPTCERALSVQPSGKAFSYYCQRCRPGASAYVHFVDDYVTDRLDELVAANDPRVIRALQTDERYDAAVEEVEVAKAELAAFIDAADVALLGRDGFRRGVEVRQTKVDAARRALRELSRPERVARATTFMEKGTAGEYREFQRMLLHRLVEECALRPAGVRGRGAPPISERLTLRFVETAIDALPEATESPSPPAKSRTRGNRRPAATAVTQPD